MDRRLICNIWGATIFLLNERHEIGALVKRAKMPKSKKYHAEDDVQYSTLRFYAGTGRIAARIWSQYEVVDDR